MQDATSKVQNDIESYVPSTPSTMDVSRALNNFSSANRDIGKLIFESVENSVEDALIANQIEIMKSIAKDLQTFVCDHPFSIKVQGFLCGVLITLCCLISLLFNALNANLCISLIYAVMTIISLLFAILEYKAYLVPSRISNWIKEEMRWVILCIYLFIYLFICLFL